MVRGLPETLGEPRAQYVIMKPDFFQLQKSTEPITVENRKYTDNSFFNRSAIDFFRLKRREGGVRFAITGIFLEFDSF
jgi:hypothetical protein